MKRLRFWGAILIFAILMLKPEETIHNAQQAMGVWYSSVAPALFPFLVLMPLLISEEACKAYEVMFSKWMRPMFRLPGSAAPAIIAGMISGSPGGAIALCRVTKNGGLSASEARRIALALGGVSPAYLIMGVGQGLHGSVSLGIKLAIMQVGIQLLMLLIIPNEDGNEKPIPVEDIAEVRNPITSAVESIIGVCGYMVFYSVIAGAMVSILGKGIGEILLPLMDLPSGLAGLVTSDLPLKLIIQGMAIGFSGLCIISQNINALQGLNLKWKQYISARIVSGILFGILSLPMESGWNSVATRFPQTFRKTYAISLLIVGIIIVPGLIFISKKSFLNIRKNGNHR